ncbi:hypothetical protein ACP4OV_005035 [Aristida adscensionis]
MLHPKPSASPHHIAMSSLLLIIAALTFLLPPSSSAAAEQIKTTSLRLSLHFPLPDGVTGAESLAFDRRGLGPYTGVSDGRILMWRGRALGWTTFAYNANYLSNPTCAASTEETENICGRPLGVQFYGRTGELYIADAYLGLMKVGPLGGEAEVLATEADGVPFHFVNGLDVDQSTGDVYFTDSSTKYTRRSNRDIMVHRDATGRLLKYDAQAKKVTVLLAGLPYPNGVALSGDRTHVVVAHTGPCQVFRYWIEGSKAGQYELFADLPGYPDNMRRDTMGGYWAALNREKLQSNASSTAPVKHLVGVRLDVDGRELEEMTAADGITLSDVAEKNGQLWLGSVELDYVGLLR